jgi:hypothetical protein
MNELADQQTTAPEVREVGALARELATAYRAKVNHAKKTLGLSAQQAVAKVEEPCPLDEVFRIEDCPPEDVTFADIDDLARVSPARALQCWERIKQAAREELQSGHRAAVVLEGHDADAWKRAQFLALREELSRELRPRNGVERQLIDQMAQVQTQMYFWQERLSLRASVEPLREKRELEEEGGWSPPRVSEHQALEQAAAMVDRFNKMFLRTLRALRDLRRYTGPVIVQNAGQVNVGGQQVNVTAGEQ